MIRMRCRKFCSYDILLMTGMPVRSSAEAALLGVVPVGEQSSTWSPSTSSSVSRGESMMSSKRRPTMTTTKLRQSRRRRRARQSSFSNALWPDVREGTILRVCLVTQVKLYGRLQSSNYCHKGHNLRFVCILKSDEDILGMGGQIFGFLKV